MTLLTNPTLAFGLSGVNDYSTALPFLDLMKTSRPIWAEGPSLPNLGHADVVASGVLDANGWPTEFPSGGYNKFTTIWAFPSGTPGADGPFVLTWEGEGTISLGDVVVQSSGDHRIEFTNPTGNTFWLQILATDPNDTGDYIKNIRIIPEKYEALADLGQIFNPDWLAVVQDARQLRFMDWMRTNGSTQSEWADRPQVDDVTWSGQGVPVEVMVELANQTGTDPWFTMPHLATDEYIEEFATYVRDHLDPDLVATVEYSNETWNTLFPQANWLKEQVQTAILTVSGTSGTPEIGEEFVGSTSGARGYLREDRGDGKWAVYMFPYGPVSGGSLTRGDGYVPGTYTGVVLSGGSGSSATATIVVSDGATDGQVNVPSGRVYSVTITNSGDDYELQDVLTTDNSNLGGTGEDFSYRVTGVNVTGNPVFTTETITGQTSATTASVTRRQWGAVDGYASSAWLAYHSKRATETAVIWDTVFGEEADGRVQNVMAVQTVAGIAGQYGQLQNQYLTNPLWESNEPEAFVDPASVFDAVAVTTYFGSATTGNTDRRNELLNYISSHTTEESYDWLATKLLDPTYSSSIPQIATTWAAIDAVVSGIYGLDLVVYEGGQHVHQSFGVSGITPEQLNTLTTFMTGFVRSQQMADLYAASWAAWAEISDGPYMQFGDVGQPGQFGSWALLNNLTDTNPRAEFIFDQNNNQDAWFGDGGGDFYLPRQAAALEDGQSITLNKRGGTITGAGHSIVVADGAAGGYEIVRNEDGNYVLTSDDGGVLLSGVSGLRFAA